MLNGYLQFALVAALRVIARLVIVQVTGDAAGGNHWQSDLTEAELGRIRKGRRPGLPPRTVRQEGPKVSKQLQFRLVTLQRNPPGIDQRLTCTEQKRPIAVL